MKENGHLEEQVYRAGTPDHRVPPGLYAEYLAKANSYLEKAAEFAEPAQAKAIRDLIRYYQTGDPKDWLQFDIDWVQNNAPVDFANGFIEVYRDARGAKGNVAELRHGDRQQRGRVDAQDRRQRSVFRGSCAVGSAIPQAGREAAARQSGGDRDRDRRFSRHHGRRQSCRTKTRFTKSTAARAFCSSAVRARWRTPAAFGTLEEFAATPEEIALGKKYGDEAEDLMTALHEIIGHGSGKVNPKLTHDPAFYLKEYYSTLEEGARRFDGAVERLGSQGARARTDLQSRCRQGDVLQRRSTSAITQLRRIPKGDTIEEDHERDRQLIVNYIRDKTGAIAEVKRNGKTYLEIRDFAKMRQGVGQLLAELMRIKAEGDYDAIKALIDKYGVHFDPALRDQVMERYRKLDIPTYWAGINPELTASFDSAGRISEGGDFLSARFREAAARLQRDVYRVNSVGYFARTSFTLSSSDPRVNGFCRNAVPGGRSPE